MACTYEYKGKWYTEEQLLALPEFKVPFGIQQMERDYINNNTAEATDSNINFFPSEAGAGVYVRYIQFKRGQLLQYQERLNKIENLQRRKDIGSAELVKLNNIERELKLRINGNFELGITGLKAEIAELGGVVTAIGYYINKDLERLHKLVRSNDTDELREAERLIDFYNLAGTFERGVENPFFTQEEMFLQDEDGKLTSEYAQSEATMQEFKDWRDQAIRLRSYLIKSREEVTTNEVNNDPGVQKMRVGLDGNLSFGDITSSEKGLKDTDWVSMWTMDVTQGIFSTNGILPQVMFSYLSNSFEKKLAWARQVEEDIDKMNPGVQKELMRLGYSLRGSGILGIKGASYQIFKEITKEGNETGGLIQRFNKEFYDQQSSALNEFSEKFGSANAITDYAMRQRAINAAFENLKRWRRNNTVIMDISKTPEIAGDTPENQAYKAKLVQLLGGEKGYNEQLDNQNQLLKKYNSERQSMIETLIVMEGVTDYDQLSGKAKSDLSYWENNHDPKRGIEDYNSITGIFFGSRKSNSFMDYNTFIPRRFTPNIVANQSTNEYEFNDTTTSTNNYSGKFQEIEDNPVLSPFYDKIKEVCDIIRENMPYELQRKLPVNSIPALRKTSSEIMADKNIGVLSSLFQSFKNMYEKFRLTFGVVKQSEFSVAVTDPITGRANYKVNDQFLQGNTRAVRERQTIEKYKFLSANNLKGLKINRFTKLQLNTMTTEALIMLAEYANVDISLADIEAKNLTKIEAVTGPIVEIGKFIRDYSMHTVVQSQSFDLGKIAKYYSNMAMAYAARQEALPILEIMKSHYDEIKRPKTNNLNNGIFNLNSEDFMKDGLRTNAMKQMDDWFERVALDNYGTKHLGPHGNSKKVTNKIKKIEDRIKEIDDILANKTYGSVDERNRLIQEREKLLIKTKIPTYGRSIYSDEEKKKLAEIDRLLSEPGLSGDKVKELTRIKEGLGKARTATAFFDNVLTWIRTMRLGYNVSSGTVNFLEGVTSNMILAAGGDYFDSKEIYYGYNVVKHSFIKNLTFGMAETKLAKKNRKLMDKFNVIMDSKNELQKSSVKSYASKLSWLGPHELNQRVEYINQSPIMIAMLRTMKIKDESGKESSIWDAMLPEGHLKPEFRSLENIHNWEELRGPDYLAFKQKLHKAIVLGHGNYHELRGMMIKSSTAGKALMMFKTWIPMQFYWRFATEQDDVQSGTRGYKGRYWSYGAGGLATHLGVVGLAAFGPFGALAGGVLGAFLGNHFGADSGVGFIKEVLEANKQMFKKVVGMPVNLIAGKRILDSGDSAYKSWVGKGEFSEADARNMRSNMADLSTQLAWIALVLLVKGMLWDDDDEPDDPARMAHNILVNKLVMLSSQAGMYVNPVDTYKSTLGSNAVMQYLTDVGKEMSKVSEALHGRDIIQSGRNAGESGLWNQSKKTFLPGIFKDPLLGLESQAEAVFEESPFHPYFKSEATKDKEGNKRDRAEKKLELEEELNPDNYEGEDEKEKLKARDKDIRKQLDEEFPTPTKLKKLGLTREEYDAMRQEQEQ